jgi:hypothetical protein
MPRTTTAPKPAIQSSATTPPWKGKGKDLRSSPEAIAKRLKTLRDNQRVKAAKSNGSSPVAAPAPSRRGGVKGSKHMKGSRLQSVERALACLEAIEEQLASGEKVDFKEVRIQTLLALKELQTATA